MYSYRTGLGQVWVGAKLPPNPASNIIWLRPSDDHRVLWEIRTYNIYKEKWEVLTSAALTAEGLLVLIRDLEKDVKSLQELKAVLYDTVQNLTPEQQQIARQNIGAISLEDLPPQVEVVQEVGTSTTNVMSQKAVTKELFALDTEIDNVKKELEEEISNAFNLEELEKHAVLYDKEQALSDDQKSQALANIGADFVRLPYSLLNTTLSDEMLEVVDNARGIILVDTPSDYQYPSVFIKGNNISGSCIFVAFVTGNTYCIFTLNKSTKLLSGISSSLSYVGSVRYAEEQSLTDTQKETARSNINAVGSSMIKGVEIVHETAPMQEDNILYIELEETT